MTTLYSNYYDADIYNETVEYLKEELGDDFSESDVWDEIADQNDIAWADLECELKEFFEDKTVIFDGTVGTWRGNFAGGRVGKFMDTLYKLTKDCDYLKMIDDKGHFYVECSHHDGTNHMEVKVLNERGETYLSNWENNWNDPRSKEDIYSKIMERYSTLPHFAKKVYGREC